jgi:catechol 2,3-dioxygenase-like lactoylglutathione lyase family enzyme
MNKSHVGHIQFLIDPKNILFYKDLFTFLGWSVIFDDPNCVGLLGEHGASLWFTGPAKAVSNDYDGPGMNHLGIGVNAQSDVDEAAAYLEKQGVRALFETPRHRPEFCGSPDETYYQVMFESPDRILLEVVYTGPKAK